MKHDTCILGAGMTGLAAGLATGAPIYEAAATPGGICSSYYLRAGGKERIHHRPADGETYRFEIGGGHWLFGGDDELLAFVSSFAPVRTYARRSGVYFPDEDRHVPYPLQYHLAYLDEATAQQALEQMRTASPAVGATLSEWLVASFGSTLCTRFFAPFHVLYTAGLWTGVAPQDNYKTPVDLDLVRRGAEEAIPAVGYNARFAYPIEGLDTFAAGMAGACDVRYGKRVVGVDAQAKRIDFEDGSSVLYRHLISTLPLHRMVEMANASLHNAADPYTSVLVINMGAKRGATCPDTHWLYIPQSEAGFHRVGFYSNVDVDFLPRSRRGSPSHVSLYIERAYPGGMQPSSVEVDTYVNRTIEELRGWGYIEEVEVVDTNWVETAYTWRWPDSTWRDEALAWMSERDITMLGRYGRWHFQGIAASLKEGLALAREDRALHRAR